MSDAMSEALPRHLLCGHWHRHRQHRIPGSPTHVVVLSSASNPTDPQYAWLVVDRLGELHMEIPAPWIPGLHGLPRGGDPSRFPI